MLSPFDKNLFVIVIFLIITGLITTFSAMVPREIKYDINPIGIIIKQIGFISAGLVGLFYFSRKTYSVYVI